MTTVNATEAKARLGEYTVAKDCGNMTGTLTATIESKGDGYVALSPEPDVASQGDTVEEARANLREAAELFLETAAPSEIAGRLHAEVSVTRLEVSVA